ncbi:DUF397 domain-containing protein [Nocardia uniformis]|uniref:DUF397 domain-containing protein n=1 Tax=Nocardia uniformis TaxID=53432 RepID=A0A849BWA1_9NOCA|nr:DUF397 domain-containing protein [Nocardia uniformis]NNH68570.1 DUF397 domain-containing protein [Nocardia uniformis]
MVDPVGAEWFKSRYSGSQGDCVEVAWLPGGGVGIRDSKNPTGPALIFEPDEWDTFATKVAGGEFNRS